jgi:hypothetical protein
MNKGEDMKKMILIFAVMLLMLFGCVKINMTQKVETDGSSTMTMVMDMTKLIELSPDSAKTNPCDNQNETILQGGTCTYSNGVMTVTTKGDPTKYKFTTESGIIETKYRFEMPFSELSKTASSGDSSGMDTNSLNTPEAKQQLAQMKSMGVEMNYTVEMPGTITSAEGGKISGNKATFDLLEMFASETTPNSIVIESTTMNTTMLAAGLVGLVIVILVLLKVMKKI